MDLFEHLSWGVFDLFLYSSNYYWDFHNFQSAKNQRHSRKFWKMWRKNKTFSSHHRLFSHMKTSSNNKTFTCNHSTVTQTGNTGLLLCRHCCIIPLARTHSDQISHCVVALIPHVRPSYLTPLSGSEHTKLKSQRWSGRRQPTEEKRVCTHAAVKLMEISFCSHWLTPFSLQLSPLPSTFSPPPHHCSLSFHSAHLILPQPFICSSSVT